MSNKISTISIVAAKAGVGVETIRYYQRIGLIEEPEKPLSGYRIYPDSTVSRLGFIKRAKELGFSLAEISNLLKLGDGKCLETKELASHKLTIIQSKIHDLKSMEKLLQKLIESCEENLPDQSCPIIEAISKK